MGERSVGLVEIRVSGVRLELRSGEEGSIYGERKCAEGNWATALDSGRRN